MASSRRNDVVEDLLQCSVCMEPYEESGRRVPKVLPCQHSFCVDCLESICSRGSIRCPNCRKECSTTVDQLSRSLVLIQLLGARETSQRATSLKGATPPPNSAVCYSNIPKLLKENYRDPAKANEYLRKLTDRVNETKRFKLDEMEAVLKCMQYYRIPNDTCRPIQLTATAFVYRSISVGRAALAPEQLVSEVATEIITTIEIFKDDQLSAGLLQNCLAILSLDHVLNQVTFHGPKLAGLLMDIITTTRHAKIQEWSVWCFISTCRRLSGSDIAKVGSNKYIRILLGILKSKYTSTSQDRIIVLLLNLLTSLTDETPSTCRNIINSDGIPVFAMFLENEDFSAEIKKATLLNLSNLSEVPELRLHFLDDKGLLVRRVKQLMHSIDQSVKYCAVSLLSNLLTLSFKEWRNLTKSPTLRKEVLKDMYDCVMKWHGSALVSVIYTSFKPFYQLLERYDAPPLQLFSAWTIRHFCLLDPQKYQEILIKEEGIEYLLNLKENPYTDKNVVKLVEKTLESIH